MLAYYAGDPNELLIRLEELPLFFVKSSLTDGDLNTKLQARLEEELLKRGFTAAYSLRACWQVPQPRRFPSSVERELTAGCSCLSACQARRGFSGISQPFGVVSSSCGKRKKKGGGKKTRIGRAQCTVSLQYI